LIICQNCGTTNNEAITHICRTCGALLPVPSKSTRSKRIKPEKKKKEKEKTSQQPQIEPKKLEKINEENLELQEIPTEDVLLDEKAVLQEIPKSPEDKIEIKTPPSDDTDLKSLKTEVLQEIPVQPYRSTIMDARKSFHPPSSSTNSISEAFTELRSSILDKDQEQKISISPLPRPLETTDSTAAALKQKTLEKDMTKVLSFLSKKISVKKLEIPESKSTEKTQNKDEIPPSSMNDILKRLIKLDLNIEASAIIKTDGTILASAISSRISDSLFATIGMNLSMMGSDIIEGLDAGKLRSISVRGTEGILDLAPIDKENPSVKDMILVILSHPKTKSGIISFAVNIVKKQLKEYLGIQK
jgi:predicted regulator of Ras-like GTPase activity (Roadblock/LC7/MglB family)